ncbi:MAG: methionyl-tRNA formyltransferase, partial [Bacteroidales bacterium]|nr:methionyl-tRNA formyltransferase [Bacteroidales bacterium]
MRIVFMGTPDFASGVLRYIIAKKHDVVAVVTVPDKPSGRGQKITSSAVKNEALKNNIPVLQPMKLKDPDFLEELATYKANVFVVVAFRMLPKQVWNMPPMGTFNLHASLLPQFRGAAPINHAIISGETKTGVTTFFINEEIDTGDIIDAVEVPIDSEDDAGTLHDKLMTVGAELVHTTLLSIQKGNVPRKSQVLPEDAVLKPAPKIFKEFCRIDFSKNGVELQNFVRGLSPYPTAFCELGNNSQKSIYLKIFRVNIQKTEDKIALGTVRGDSVKELKIRCLDSWVYVEDLQMLGK